MAKKIHQEQSITAAVMIAGAGIAGMQAALDLADAGFKVYLVENGAPGRQQSAKGRTAAQRTLCCMSPKLLAVQVQRNIELIENASVEDINGSAGNFLVTVNKEPAASARGTARKTKKDSSRNHADVAVGAIIFAPGFNSLAAARYEFKKELRTQAEKHGFSIPGKKAGTQGTSSPHTTSRPGIFMTGDSGTSEIKAAIIEGSSVAALAAELLSSVRGALAPEKKYPAEMRVSGEEPAIGIFVCKQILADTKAVTGIIAGARKLASVVHAEKMQELCSRASLQQVTSAIAEHRLNRVVAVTCNPQAHEPLFQEALAEAGLNRYLLVMADTGNAGAQQTQVKRASDIIRMAVARARLLEPLREISSEVAQRGLVIGSGLSAMTAALSLANQGFDVCLVEQEKEGKSAGAKPQGKQVSEDIKRAQRTLHKQITGHRRIELFSAARIIGFTGHPGCYTTTLSVKGANKTLKHGMVIIEPGQVQEDLAVMLKIPVTPDGSYLRPDEMLPLDLACGGMFCCGYEDCREEMRRSIVLGRAAAARAATILAKRELILSSSVSVVDPERCVACLACVRDCPYRAPAISEEGVAFIEPADCRGCGICVSVCPRKAIDLKHYTDEQILAELTALVDLRS